MKTKSKQYTLGYDQGYSDGYNPSKCFNINEEMSDDFIKGYNQGFDEGTKDYDKLVIELDDKN